MACTSRSKLIQNSLVGAENKAGVADVILEAALSTIVDLEDSVVGGRCAGQGHGLPQLAWTDAGKLDGSLEKNGLLIERRLAEDRTYIDRDGAPMTLHGRSLLLVRNVGHHMQTDAVLDKDGNQIPETILDAAVTTLIAHP